VISIIPAILTNNFSELQEKMLRLENTVERVQIDIIDGLFANNKTVEPQVLEDIETSLFIDYHLMVKEPIEWVERCIRGQADRIIGHIELMRDQVEFVEKVAEAGVKVGLAIDLDTPLASLDKAIITDIDVLLVMSVPAGFGGQKFNKETLLRIADLDELRLHDNSPFTICVDGGITVDVIRKLYENGADEATIGKRAFEGDIKANIERFQMAAHEVK
jgi:ribulose-phosphate 3-epimerase